MPPDKSTQVTFLDTEGFFLSEHQIKQDGHWRNWYTCLKDISEDGSCPLCEEGDNPAYICAFTVIDHTKFTTKKGTKVVASKRLLVLKSTARNKVLKQKERRDGDLVGCKFEVTRYNKKEAATGEDWEFLQRVDMKEFGEALKEAGVIPEGQTVEEFLHPYDYEEIFHPLTPEEMRTAAGIRQPIGSEESAGGEEEKPSAKRGISDLL